jgi:hypothetical protein
MLERRHSEASPAALTNLIQSSKGFEDKVERAGQLRRP